MSYICYVLRSLNPLYPNRTYTGITNNSERRLNEHNNSDSRGARATRILRPVTYFIKITNLTKSQALSIERKMHNMKRKNKYHGISGSMELIDLFIQNGTIDKKNVSYIM